MTSSEQLTMDTLRDKLGISEENARILAIAPRMLTHFKELRNGTCWCPLGTGHPLYSEHSAACKEAQSVLDAIEGRTKPCSCTDPVCAQHCGTEKCGKAARNQLEDAYYCDGCLEQTLTASLAPYFGGQAPVVPAAA